MNNEAPAAATATGAAAAAVADFIPHLFAQKC